MIETESCNCIVCAKEIDSDTSLSVALSKINVTNFKICQACLDSSNPEEEYRQVREIVNSYLRYSEAKNLFVGVQAALDFRGKLKS